MSEKTMIERVGEAIENAKFRYSIELVRLVDGVSTYYCDADGDGPRDFASLEEAHQHIATMKAERQARAAIEAMTQLDEQTLRLMAAAAQAQSVDKPFQWTEAAEASHIAMIFSALQSAPDSKGEVPG